MAGADDVNSTLQNVARNIALWAQSAVNALPIATTTSSPQATPVNNLGTTATSIIGSSTTRHGLIFHNPGTANVYVFPSLTSTSPSSTTLGGSLLIAAGSSVVFPSAQFPNINCGWSAFATTGSNQPFTILEFF